MWGVISILGFFVLWKLKVIQWLFRIIIEGLDDIFELISDISFDDFDFDD